MSQATGSEIQTYVKETGTSTNAATYTTTSVAAVRKNSINKTALVSPVPRTAANHISAGMPMSRENSTTRRLPAASSIAAWSEVKMDKTTFGNNSPSTTTGSVIR